MQRTITSILCACAALVALTASGAARGSLKLKTGVMKGTIGWSVREKKYVVTEKNNLEQQVDVKDVEEIDIEKPAEFDAAIAQVAKGQGAAAIPALQKIVKEYAHLQWDKVAGRYLAEAYLADNKPKDAVRVCEAIIKEDKDAAHRGELAPAYWNALLLGSESRRKLEGCLAEAMKGEDRFARGAALIMYGDIAMKDGGETPDACKKALTDGYLRVVYLYKDDEVANRLRPEALYKAARCFDKLGNRVQLAEKMRTDLKSNYPDSPLANK